MSLLLVLFFVAGYALIVFEHPLKIDKAASALLTGVGCWVLLLLGFDSMPLAAVAGDRHALLDHALFEHLGSISAILFFLLGAMTIVELIDAHDGFRIITDRITTSGRVKLLWIISWIAFFLSAVLDNMTTAIILCALLRRMLRRQEDIWLMCGFVVIAANAGGAWSPIGDVTTIMLWIGGHLSTMPLIQALILPSAVSLLVPLLAASYFMRGQVELRSSATDETGDRTPSDLPRWEQALVLLLGSGGLLFVPVFKSLTHYPPYLGILLAVGVLWFVTELLHRKKHYELRHGLTVAAMLRRIDSPSILFFLGILLAVGALETSGHLQYAAGFLDHTFGNIFMINTLIGLLSAVVDNVPLVAACMGMYETKFATDHTFWNLLAYCAGTGGSILVIGSAAGVAAMGIVKFNFLWYLRRISLYALAGYLAGVLVYSLFES